MKKLLILGATLLVSPLAYAAEEETTHDVKVELRDLGKGPDGKQILHFKPIQFGHKNAAHEHNKHAETFLKPGADAGKHDAAVAKAKPSLHTIRLKIKKNDDGKQSISSEVIGHEDPKSENNEKAAVLFSRPTVPINIPLADPDPYAAEKAHGEYVQELRKQSAANNAVSDKGDTALFDFSKLGLVIN